VRHAILLLSQLITLGALFGCTGQSGTEPGCDDPTHCICKLTDRMSPNPLRATVTGIEGTHIELRIDEVFDPSTQPPSIMEGVTIGGTVESCGTMPVLASGTQTLAFYSRGTQDGPTCPELLACIERDCGAPPEEGPDYLARAAEYDRCATECQTEKADACAARSTEAMLNGRLELAVQTTDGWNFGLDDEGQEIQIGLDEVGLLSDRDACDARFPPDATECSDVVYSSGTGGDEVDTVAGPPPAEG